MPVGTPLFSMVDGRVTTAIGDPAFEHGNAYNNQIASFQNPLITAVYLVGVAALTSHLFHGFWSLTQSLGVTPSFLDERTKRHLAATAAVIGAGYASMPLAVITGIIDYQ